jgi:hypothetical protein
MYLLSLFLLLLLTQLSLLLHYDTCKQMRDVVGKFMLQNGAEYLKQLLQLFDQLVDSSDKENLV